jgi:KDO2-lipid IV(A) lauroyltransferase
MKHKIIYLLTCLFIGFIRSLPMRVGGQIGNLLGMSYYWIDARHRRITLEHLHIALGQDAQRLQKIAKNAYRNIGRSIVETFYLPNLPLDWVKQSIPVEGLDHFIEAKQRGKGIIILTAHLGNWEIIPKLFWAHQFRIHALVRPLDNPYLDRMVQGWRTQNGMGVLNKRTDVGRILKLLREGEAVGFLLDQNAVEKDAVFVDFFGREAATPKGPAVLALRSDATVLPVFMIRQPDGHRMVIQKPIPIMRTRSASDDIVQLTTQFTQTIESVVARYPDQWLWLHRRWKTQRTRSSHD